MGELREKKLLELSALQQNHEENTKVLRDRVESLQAQLHRNEQTAMRREAALAKRSEQGSKAASPAESMPGLVVPQRPLPNGHERRKALLVGVNYATSHAPLKGCVNDVWNLKCLLQYTLQYTDDQVKMLIDCADGRTPRPEKVPTKANIIAGLRWLMSGAQPGDNLVRERHRGAGRH